MFVNTLCMLEIPRMEVRVRMVDMQNVLKVDMYVQIVYTIRTP